MSELLITHPAERTQLHRLAALPTAWLAVLGPLVCALLLVPLRLPIGGYYWDLDLYLNAAHRFSLGQVPHVDYFSQVGSLSLALFALTSHVFPRGNPVLAAQWSVLIVTLPLMGALVREVHLRSRAVAAALVLPFIVFSFLPYNNGELFVSQAPDAFGIYNRQVGLVLYVLVATIMWSRSPTLQIVVCSVSLSAITFLKITGIAPALIFVVYGVLSRRLQPRTLVYALGGLAAVTLALEWRFGLASALARDVFVLASMNTGSLLVRIIGLGARQFQLLLTTAIIVVICILSRVSRGWNHSDWGGLLAKALASDLAWIIVATGGAFVYESQNTGSNEFIYLWPVWVRALLNAARRGGKGAYVLGLLIALANVPLIMPVIQRTARASIQSLNLAPLPAAQLGGFGLVTVADLNLDRAQFMLGHYARFPTAYQDMSSHGHMQSADLFTKSDFQAFYLLSLEEALAAIRAYETGRSIRLRSVFTLDFVDPLSHLLGARPPRLVSLAIDPRRTFPRAEEAVMQEVAEMDALIVPLCPAFPDRDSIAQAFAPAMKGREAVDISPCWRLLLRPGLAPAAS